MNSFQLHLNIILVDEDSAEPVRNPHGGRIIMIRYTINLGQQQVSNKLTEVTGNKVSSHSYYQWKHQLYSRMGKLYHFKLSHDG